jgi:hypothetical protein
MYKWSRENVKQSEVIFQSQREDGNKKGQRMSSHTVVDWKNFCRDIAAEYCLNYKPKLGGPNIIVEIDETLWMKRKYQRGSFLNFL